MTDAHAGTVSRQVGGLRPGVDGGADTGAGAAMTVGDELDVFHCPLDGIRLIEASAGTGKTWAICGLVLRLLLERGLTVQQVLVVTFTEAATAELRERVRGRLAEVLDALQPGAPAASDPFVVGLLHRLRDELGQSKAAMAQRLAVALHGFDEAAIFTIHGFCQRALADAPFAAGLPMATEVLQDDSELRDEAVKAAWRAEVSGVDWPPALAALLLARKDTPQAWSMILKKLLARPLAQRRWPAALEAHGAFPVPDLAVLERSHRELAQRWAAERGAVVGALHAALPQFKANIVKAEGLALGAVAWDAWLSSGDALAPLDDENALRLYTRSKLLSGIRAHGTLPVHPFFEQSEALLRARVDADAALTLARAWLLRRVLSQAEAALRRHKREQGLVAFDDMLFNLHERLHDAAAPDRALALATTLRERYPVALIDEFQDTDPLQFAIFRSLYQATPDEAQPKSAPRSTLFLVGDPKQAIYSFRNADLPTYLQARALAASTYSLAHNQRSTAGLVEALNRLFTRHPQGFMQAGLNYRPVTVGDKPRSTLIDLSQPDEPPRRAALQLWRLPEDPLDGLPLLRTEAHAMALQATAAEIARLLGEAHRGRITLDGRPLRAGDIAVLVRSHGQGAEVRQALAARGIRGVELSQASVYHSIDAEEVARVLTAVLHPARERLLRAALATELFGRGARALDLSTTDDAPGEAPDATGLMPEMLRFSTYRDSWQRRGVAVMLRQMMVGEQLATRMLQLPQGERRLTNWLHLGECLHQAETEHAAPEALLRWFEHRRADEAIDEASQLRLESDQNLVQIVTIHKAKGLEYPFVFCPFLWGVPHRTSGSGDLAIYHDADDEPAMVLDFRAGLDPAYDAAAVKRRLWLDAAAEDLRLVYVALTRAVHRCHLVVGCSSRGVKGGKSAVAGCHTLLNWLVAGAQSSAVAWLTAKPAQTTPERVEAAWRELVRPGFGALSLTELPALLAPADPASNATDAERLPTLRSLPPLDHVPSGWAGWTGWAIGSYSALVRGRLAAGGDPAAVDATDQIAIDHDAVTANSDADALTDEDITSWDSGDDAGLAPLAASADAWVPDDILRFPRGAAAGDCIHQVFERVDFTQPAGWPGAVQTALQGLPGGDAAERPALAAMLLRMLRDVCATPLLPDLPKQPGLRLGGLAPAQRLTELEFHLAAPALSASALNRLLADFGHPMATLSFGQLRGYLRGFIDLVFEHQGRTYVLDWKSNHLGPRATDYGQAGCERAMAQHGYHLQAMIYSLALDRLLRLRRADYRPEHHFGGVFYLFVRGVRPEWTDDQGRPRGVHFTRPTPQMLADLARVLAGGASP